ncbi:SHOCT domain-containing protein [Natrarchaeobaculum aegyptiacum]|uniref:SHOCT domain-containing protein n=1 Tax=Natrarchaeobaculum aegyptiacum TaxID=745377 RepID=UPI001E2B38AB|nr:SHOCT domain-containing protein [Natrarchaeobaculum aegyptiacum]
MYDLIHRFAPSSPAGRTAVAIVASLVGVPAAVLGLLMVLGGGGLAGLAFLFVGLATLAVAGTLTLGVVRQANAAPDATPLTAPRTDNDGGNRPGRRRRRSRRFGAATRRAT